MQNKLHINLSQGIIDVEGDAELVRAIYEDFKGKLSPVSTTAAASVSSFPTQASSSAPSAPSAKLKKRNSAKRKNTHGEVAASAFNPDAPKRDKSLDTSKLLAFYQQFEPVSAPEKILIFLKFLVEHGGIPKPNTDQIYTCFLDVKEKPPQAFAQAFRDTATKKGFIDFNSAEDIVLTTKGNNHFEFDLKRKKVE